MSDIFLIGSEDVRRAGGAIQGAACDMAGAANTFSDVADRLMRSFESCLDRLEFLMERVEKMEAKREVVTSDRGT